MCNIITYDHIICDYFLIDETVGVFSLFSGIAKLNFTAEESGSGITELLNQRPLSDQEDLSSRADPICMLAFLAE